MEKRPFLRRVPLRTLLVAFLVAYGIAPLGIATVVTVMQQRESMETQERIVLAHRVEALSAELSQSLTSVRDRVEGLVDDLSAAEQLDLDPEDHRAWLQSRLDGFLSRNPDLLATRVDLPREGRELVAAAPGLEAMMADEGPLALASREPVVSVIELPGGRAGALLSVAGTDPEGLPLVGVRSLVELPLERMGEADALLIDSTGEVLWSSTDSGELGGRGLVSSQLLQDFVANPAVFVSEYTVGVGNEERPVIAQVSPVGSTGWGIVVQQPKAVAFVAAQRWAQAAALGAGAMLILALLVAVGTGHWISGPVRHLAERSSEIASGQLGGRVPAAGVGRELSDLAESFNSMSARLESFIGRLRTAAQANHDLFLGSIRALLAAVEAKEPYIRGHSERVAQFSRSIAFEMGLTADQLEEIWVAGLLHDVGKIGIEDRILKKGEVLTPEEYDRVKCHTVIGADIMSSIEQLSYCVPTARFHHERWNGSGYPEGLDGYGIPLSARIVAVADSFDAMTTQRVYQEPMSAAEAIAWIRAEGGRSFDPEVVSSFIRAYDAGKVEAPLASRETVGRKASLSSTLHT